MPDSNKEDVQYGPDPLGDIPKEVRESQDPKTSFRRRYAEAQRKLLWTQDKLLKVQDNLAKERIALARTKRKRAKYEERVAQPRRDGQPDDRRKRQFLYEEFGTVVSVREAAEAMGVHITRIYAWINSGHLVRIKCGRRVYIPTSYLDDLLQDDLPDYLKEEPEQKEENDG